VYLGFTRVSQTSRYGRNFQNFAILCREPDQGIGNTSLECTTFPNKVIPCEAWLPKLCKNICLPCEQHEDSNLLDKLDRVSAY